jgi:hypothetical protein
VTEPYLDPRDADFARTLPADERETVLATVTRFRRPDRLRIGDALPDLELLRHADGGPVRLHSVVTGRPLVIVFGSFT